MKNNINIEIEHLRAVSICLVLVTHVPLLSPYIAERLMPWFAHFSMGVGVDLFFCISGYVVSKAYTDSFDAHINNNLFNKAALSFWVRRGFRLLPSAWLWVLIGIVCAAFFNQSGVFLDIKNNLISALSIVAVSANIAHLFDALAPNNAYWSLSLEEQFYFIFPFFILLAKSNKSRVIILLCIIAIFFPLNRTAYGDLTAKILFSFRIDGFAWGVLIYLFSKHKYYLAFRPVFLEKNIILPFMLSVLLIYALIAIPAELHSLSANMGMMAIAAAMLVWLASYQRSYFFNHPLITPMMNWLGSRSYSIYLIHLPAFKICDEIYARYLRTTEQASSAGSIPFLLAGAIILIVVLSELNYRFVEMPFRRIGSDFSKRIIANSKEPVMTNLIIP